MTSSHFGQTLSRFVLVGIVLAVAASSPAFACGLNSPAKPVPQERNGVQLWPVVGGQVVLRPGKPGQTLPNARDTTDRFGGLSVPNAANEHELFKSVDIVGDTLFVAYSLGIQSWDIGPGKEEEPRKLAFRDLWKAGDFIIPAPATSEQLNFISDIAAIQPSGGGNILVGVAGKMPFVGPTIWSYNRTSHFQLLYQDAGNGESGGTSILQVRMAEVGGRVYMIAVGSEGVFIYDATSATSLSRCLDNQGGVFACAGVFKGLIPSSRSRYIDTAVIGGSLYIAMGGGRDGFKISRLTPSLGSPLSAADAQTVYSSSDFFNSPAFFQHRGKWWMGVVSFTTIEIYNVDDCVDGNGCSGPTLAWQSPFSALLIGEQFLTFSRASGGRPFLYFGLSALNLSGTRVEHLIDVEPLGLNNNAISEITEPGGTYFDDCGEQVDYWGDYYGENEHGLREMHPRVGKFADNNYFYRAAQTILDVHVRNPSDIAGPAPSVETSVIFTGPYYQGDGISFAATADNCTGTENWDWYMNDGVESLVGSGGGSRVLEFPLCGDSTCPTRSVQAWAIKDACADDPNLDINRATINVQDPRARFDSIASTPSGDSHPLCTTLSFSAAPTGRPPFSYAWEAKREDGSPIDSGTGNVFVLDTSTIGLGPGIFTDGFESGTLSAWSPTKANKGIGSIPIDVQLRISNADDPTGVTITRNLTLTELGDLTLGFPGIGLVNNGAALFDFTMNVSNATEWRWVIEDPENGPDTNCGAEISTRCTIIDWGLEDTTYTYQWSTPNTAGIYKVVAQARNCQDEEVQAVLPVTVADIQEPAAPNILSFALDTTASAGCKNNFGTLECQVGSLVFFDVTYEGNPTFFDVDWNGDGTFEDEGVTVDETITHTYTATGPNAPQIRARRGAEVSIPFSLGKVISVF